MKSYLCWLLMLQLALSHTSTASETSELPIRLALGYLPPINCDNSEAGVRCINNRIIERLKHLSGINIQVRVVPYSRASYMFQNDQSDMSMVFKKINTPSNIAAVAKVYEVKLSVYTRADIENIKYSQLKIGVLRGLDNTILDELVGASLVKLADYEQGVHMLALGRLDAMFGPDETLIFLFDLYRIKELINPRPIIQFNQEVWLYCRQDSCSAKRQEQLQQAVKNIQSEIPVIRQVVPELYYKYLQPSTIN